MQAKRFDYDFIIIGSGFGGSVSALWLSGKGYKVLVIEKGKHFSAEDFPKSNWNIRKWLWIPFFRFFGFFKITFYKHIGILSGVGVGGGSLVYANTLPVPKKEFFEAESWKELADWESELKPFYGIAKKMLGVAKNPRMEIGDEVIKSISQKLNIPEKFELTDVAVFFGETKEPTPDPYFNGKGPERSGCTFCGGCMVGCRFNAKNTLDKNYLYLAKNLGAEILAEHEVINISLLDNSNPESGYSVEAQKSTSFIRKRKNFTASGIIFSGGVLGTVPLLLKLKQTTLKNLSDKIGYGIRTNSESLMGVTSSKSGINFSDGIAISSILHTDKYSHVEPVRYPSGSGFWRLQVVPLVESKSLFGRIVKMIFELIKHPIKFLRFYFVWDWASKTQILLFMQTLNSTLRFKRGLIRMKSVLDLGNPPSALLPEAQKIAKLFAAETNGTTGALLSEVILGIPTTAHILGGATMGKDINSGVIDKDNKVFGYKNMFVCDGSMISANPGVNPSLTITAITERAMSKIQNKVI